MWTQIPFLDHRAAEVSRSMRMIEGRGQWGITRWDKPVKPLGFPLNPHWSQAQECQIYVMQSQCSIIWGHCSNSPQSHWLMLILFWEGILWDSMGFGNSSFQLLLMDNVYFQREGTQNIVNKNLKKNLLIANMAVILLLLPQRQPKLNWGTCKPVVLLQRQMQMSRKCK